MNPIKRPFFCRRAPTSVGGFTLIELLTVIAIIGILIAIIIPVTGRVRSSAKQAVCLSNLRQIYTGSLLFAGDNKGLLPMRQETTAEPSINLWHRYLSPYLQAQNDESRWRSNDGVYVCPSDTRETPSISYSYNGRIKGKRLNQVDGNVIMIMEGPSYSTLGNASADPAVGFQARHNDKGFVLKVSGATVLYVKGALPYRVDDPALWGDVN